MYVDIIAGKGRNIEGVLVGMKKDPEVVQKYYSDKEDIAWASKSAIARIVNGEHVSIVKKKIIDAGFESCKIISMGGDNVF